MTYELKLVKHSDKHRMSEDFSSVMDSSQYISEVHFMQPLRKKKWLDVLRNIIINMDGDSFFLSRFSLANIQNSQDSMETGRLSL